MGISGMSWGEMLIILVVVLLVFGTGKLSRIGSDLGGAIRGFRAAMKNDAGDPPVTDNSTDAGYPGKR
jgi:sec-independent protein translocase protein TatA